jgi:PAS domain S-box-containing protein
VTTSPGAELRRLRSLVADLDAVVWEADAASGRFTFVSQRAGEILGYPPKLWTDEPSFWADHIHPDDREHAVKTFLAGATEGRPHDTEYRFMHRDGSTVWLRDIGHAVTDIEGKPIMLRGLMVDITRQRLTDDLARESELRYRRLVEQLPAIVYTESFEEDHLGLVYVSPQARELFGVDPKGWLGSSEHWLSNVHPEDRERVRQENDRSDATGEPFSSEYRILMPDGRVVWLRDEASLIRDRDGRPLFWQGVLLDITRRIHTEEQLREAEERYRALVEQTPVVTYLDALDPSSATLYVSPQVEMLLGYTPEEITAIPPIWSDLIHPADRERVLAYAAETERLERRYSIEYRMLAKDGHSVWVHDQAQLVRDEADRPRYWQGVWMDITERMRAMELEQALEVEREESAQLRELDRMKNTFLQAVSHDLRTPLAAILGLAVTLEREDVELEPEESKDLASRIAANARKLDRMVNDLLDLDRLSRGIVEPSLAPTDVGSLVSRLVSESDLVLGRSVLVHTEPAWAEVDAAKVERIVENLLANAVRHTPDGSRIWVFVDQKDDGVRIAVEDEGPGVAPDQRERIFEPFRQGPDAPEDSPGVGVGLALVARFAELHGGRAWVEDREAGSGAAFLVWLPVGNVTPADSPTVSRETTSAPN